MTLRQLRYFLAVLRAGSLTAAARSLHVAQPAVGLQVRALEDELGVGLLTRHSRGVVPTGAGDVLARDAERILAEVERMRRTITETGGCPRGRPAPDPAGGGAHTAALHARLHDAARALSFEDLELAVRVFDMVARRRGG